MKVTHGANFNRTEIHRPAAMRWRAQKSPGMRGAHGAFCLFLGRELFPYRGGAVADLVNRLLKFFLRYLQMLGPILNLPGFMHVDLRAIVLALVFQALHFFLLMKSKPANQNQASLFSKALLDMESKRDLGNFVPARRWHATHDRLAFLNPARSDATGF
jgi:hypothetical protein